MEIKRERMKGEAIEGTDRDRAGGRGIVWLEENRRQSGADAFWDSDRHTPSAGHYDSLLGHFRPGSWHRRTASKEGGQAREPAHDVIPPLLPGETSRIVPHPNELESPTTGQNRIVVGGQGGGTLSASCKDRGTYTVHGARCGRLEAKLLGQKAGDYWGPCLSLAMRRKQLWAQPSNAKRLSGTSGLRLASITSFIRRRSGIFFFKALPFLFPNLLWTIQRPRRASPGEMWKTTLHRDVIEALPQIYRGDLDARTERFSPQPCR